MKTIIVFDTEDFVFSIRVEDESKQKESFTKSSYINQLNSYNYILRSNLKSISITKEAENIIFRDSCFETNVLFFENNAYYIYFESKILINKFVYHSNRKEEEIYIDEIQNTYHNKLSFMNYVGISQIHFSYIADKEEKNFDFEFCVYPIKLKYTNDFKNILIDILKESVNLNFSLLSKTSFGFSVDKFIPHNLQNSFSDLIWIQLFLILSERFQQACKIILCRPHSQLKLYDRLIPNRKLRTFSPSLCRNNEQNILLAKTNIPTYDTIENQYVKSVLKNIQNKLNHVERILSDSKQLSSSYKNKLKYNKILLDKILSDNMFSDVSDKKIYHIHSSPIFEKKNGYNTFYKCSKLLQGNSLSVDDKIQLRIKQISSLYEIWNFILIKNILCELTGMDISVIEKDESIFISLLQGKLSKLQLLTPNIELTLYYNVTISRDHSDVDSLYSLTEEQRPDILLKIKHQSKEVYIVFDAKYRYNIKNEFEFYPVPDGINQIHRYRDSIMRRNAEKSYSQAIWGGFVLFPGYNTIDEIKACYYYSSIKYTQIGALQICPNNEDGISLLKQILYSLCFDYYA